MTKKLLFKHTISLLRTALLIGVITFVNTQQATAQTAEQWATMPDAFETMDPASIIGDGNYYYIQFYTPQHDKCSYLTDRGENKLAAVMDFLPYANNRLWTLERVNGNNFKLKSKAGYYIGFDRLEGATGNRYVSITNSGAATTFTFQNARNNDGYNIVDLDHGYNGAASGGLLGRYNNLEWLTGLSTINNDNTGKDNSRMRFAKLKSNAAFIIYYRDGGADNSDPSASTIRHYLTYSDVDAASTVMASAVTNGSLEGADASSFFFGDPDHNERLVASITDGVGNNGSRGIQITARGKDNPNDWDTQFFISADEVIPEGTTFHLEFDYRANRNATVPTQAHSAPGSYITEMPNINGISNLSFTTNWQTYSADITVSHEMGYGRGNDKGNSFQTIAFNLWRERSTNPNTIYYFDNIKLTVPTSGSAVSSRRSIIPPDKPLSTLPTIAAYHQDGLWQLEEASADGKFYIKKYDSNEYLNCDLADPYAAAFAVLGPKDETHGQYSLVDPVASRYTLVQNVQYQTVPLSPNMFHMWNGVGDGAQQTGQTATVDFQLGTALGSGGTVAGSGNVDRLLYADLTGYTKMIINGTPGMVVRVLMNRQTQSDPFDGVERQLIIGNDGKVELNLTDLTFVHLNAIKIGWGNSGIISDIEMVNRNQVNTSSPLYLNHSNGDGYPVMERNDDANNHWYAAFFPVEVPVPNKDDFFQVLVKWGDNMIDHNGHSVACPTNEADYDLWQLEMVDDYLHFRLKAPNGGYLKPGGTGVTPPNDPTDAEIMTNQKFWTDFSLTWFYVNPVDKEIPVNHWVTHRESYLKQYSITHSDLDLAAQGLATKAQSDWWVYGKEIQKVNHFEITHYVKKNNTVEVEFPTILNNSNDHIYYQRFYHYNDESCDNTLYPDGTDIEGLKAHVSLDTRDQGDVQYFLYKNGMVTGAKLDWTDNIEQGGYKRNEQRKFNFTNSDGKPFTVAVDVSRYSDMTYQNAAAPLEGDLEEPTLTMRYIYMMKDAKDMAARLTACTQGSNNWLEKKDFHFPAKQIFYENQKKAGYRGEFIGLRHVFSDYWVFDDASYVDAYNAAIAAGTDEDDLDNHLVSAVNDKVSGKIEVEIVDDPTNPTDIRLGGYNTNSGYDRYGFTDGPDEDYKGYYFYDMMDNKNSYGDSRFVVFRYPSSGEVNVPDNVEQKAYINVYLNNNGIKYQLAQFTIYFDKGTVTLPYKQINGTSPYVQSDDYKHRDPKNLIDKAGKPIAKVTFDYPTGDKYHFPDKGTSKQGWWEAPAGATIDNCSPIPLTFDKTNYSFMGFECNWGSYSIVTQMTTNYGNHQNASPANDNTYGYGDANYPALQADQGLQNGFLYIDASEQPGDICSAPFVGDFCAGDKLMFSGWISGANKAGGGDNRCPGGITLTVKGEHMVNGKMETETLYRFCPGQIYELDNGPGIPDGSGVDGEQWRKNAQGQYIDENGNVVDEANRVPNPNYDNNKYNVVWQQFYFVFTVSEKYERHWIEVNNNCVSSKGGDFMLDNVEVYCIVPEVKAEMNTPVCVHKDGSVDMSLLKLTVDFNKLVSSSGVNANTTANLGFVFLDKKVMLKTLIEKGKYSGTLEDLANEIEEGRFILGGNDAGYKAAFDAALLRAPGNENIWKSTDQTANKGAGVMIFQWNSNFNEIEQYSFYKATSANKKPVYRYTDDDGERFLVMNGNFAELPWKLNTDYYIIPANIPDPEHFTFNSAYTTFNICSECSKEDVFQIQPPYTILGLEQSDETSDYVVCEGKIPTMLVDLKGYDLNGKQVPMTGLNFDWWLGDKANGVLATLDNYHSQEKNGVKLDNALSTMRAYYPDATNLDGIVQNLSKTPNLTLEMTIYLQELIDKGQLILHQTSVSVPAEPSSAEDPYFYLVACPIHDANFSQALNPRPGTDYVAFFCDEPQGLRIKLGEKAPKLKSGFVKGENGYDDEYNYAFPEGTDPVLSIRLAKKAQFEQVRHGETTDNPLETYNESAPDTEHFLWLPIRNAEVESSSATGVVRKSRATIEESDDYNVYLASSDDPTWDKAIYKSMSGNNPSLPIVGKIVKLNAVDTKGKTDVDQTSNRLCIYFTTNFDVREGYSYTLSLPFKENAGDNACDGTILINLKIVPDYEVWTGAAGNTDWNNDQNWRRADGNLATSTTESTDGSARNNNELLVSSDLLATSPLKDYTTNYANYRTAKDRIFRKGFAPLYCTHVLIKSNEWGNAPVLYDALDGAGAFSAKPFPNLRDKDNWDSNGAEATATPILKFDMQARHYDLWQETYGSPSNKGRAGDLIAEMYQINSCDEIAFQPGAELLNAHLLNYNSAWVEYQLDTKRWYLLGSPLQGTISGEWYAPTGTAQQKTTYYEPVTFGVGYDRYSPAIYQRSWDKAKAVLYEVGSAYDKDDDKQDANLGNDDEGMWSGTDNSATWVVEGGGTADQYLDRLGYKPMGGNKANVAIRGLWSNTYNDAQVDYATGGFSVMVMNHLKGNDQSGNKAIIRLPKEDTVYDYYSYNQTGEDDGGTDTNISDVQTKDDAKRAKNRGRLKTDLLLPTSAQKQEKEATTYRYGDRRMLTRIPINESKLSTMINGIRSLTETVPAGVSNLGYYLVENPFPCGLDMNAFFATNTGLQKKYWILTKGDDSNPRQQLVQQAPSGEWVSPGTGETNFSVSDAVVAPGQGFFVQATTAGEGTAIIFNKDMQAQTRYGLEDQGTLVTIEVGREPVMIEKEFQVDEDGDGIAETTITESVPDYEADGVTPKTTPITQDVIVYTYVQDTSDGKQFPLRTRGEDEETILPGLVITAQREDFESSALVIRRGTASNDFLPEEDTETFITSDLQHVPTIYTLCGRLATTINSIHDFRSLSLGVESNSDSPCTLTFKGVEMLGDSVSFYDAVERKLTPLESGMQVSVSGQTQNRYYLVRGLNLKEAAEETHLQIFTEGLTAKVIASTAEPILVVRCFDTSGRLLYTANPDSAEHSFTLPGKGIYIIEAQTENDRKTKKVMTK